VELPRPQGGLGSVTASAGLNSTAVALPPGGGATSDASTENGDPPEVAEQHQTQRGDYEHSYADEQDAHSMGAKGTETNPDCVLRRARNGVLTAGWVFLCAVRHGSLLDRVPMALGRPSD
jgi:hypothetical protein